jgi:hypothetical protein
MADATQTTLEPSIGPTPVSAAASDELRASAEPAASPDGGAQGRGSHYAIDQLSRIEDKTARIEEKYARSEAILQRVGSTVEAATSRMNEVASQSELAALRSEVSSMASKVRGLPGKTALVAVAIVTSLLTAAIVLLLIRYMPGAMPR